MTADDPLTMLAAGEAFYAGALSRITRLMVVLAVLSGGAVWWKYGWRVALGFVLRLRRCISEFSLAQEGGCGACRSCY